MPSKKVWLISGYITIGLGVYMVSRGLDDDYESSIDIEDILDAEFVVLEE